MKILKKSIVCVMLNAAFYGLITNTVSAWSSGPPAYRTGAAGDNGTCDAEGCHNSYSLNSGSAIFSIKPPTAYSAGKAIKIKVAFSNLRSGVSMDLCMLRSKAAVRRLRASPFVRRVVSTAIS